ncbi:MAG: DUF1385 domain-containing protein [Oscillospiraceae bacterium]|nr:DUF1385 domain-containing protein [Oscillospiraceae bacterium]
MAHKNQTKCITSIGGQALMEGIMMRGPKRTVVACRLPDKRIETVDIEQTLLQERYPILKKPFIRGVVNMVQSFIIGFKALGISADFMATDETVEQSKFDKWCEEHFGDKLMGAMVGIAGFFGVCLAIGLFLFLPALIFNGLHALTGYNEGFTYWRSPIEGGLRIAIFIAYMFICSLMPSIKRMFQYHGAEHKTIFCYENQLELTVDNVRTQSRFHPRCGTSFLILMLIVGIVIGFFIPFSNPIIRTVCKLLLLPLSVSLGYELIKLCARHDNVLTRIIAAPGLWVQRITVKEPTDDMMEVAIRAMKEVIPENGEDLLRS